MKKQKPNKTCIHCGEEFNEKNETLALECQQCITKDYQE